MWVSGYEGRGRVGGGREGLGVDGRDRGVGVRGRGRDWGYR